ncbi:hypothetical protein ACLB2K_008262 [Fragaria x ananassa]
MGLMPGCCNLGDVCPRWVLYLGGAISGTFARDGSYACFTVSMTFARDGSDAWVLRCEPWSSLLVRYHFAPRTLPRELWSSLRVQRRISCSRELKSRLRVPTTTRAVKFAPRTLPRELWSSLRVQPRISCSRELKSRLRVPTTTRAVKFAPRTLPRELWSSLRVQPRISCSQYRTGYAEADGESDTL